MVRVDTDLCAWQIRSVRLLGLDLGSRTIGLAVGDEVDGVATALRTLSRQGGERDLQAVVGVAEEQEAEGFVLGLPVDLSGEEGLGAAKVRRFGAQLERFSERPVHYWDERFSTVAAERVLLDAGLRRRTRKQVVDQVAATVILQGFFDHKRGSCREDADDASHGEVK